MLSPDFLDSFFFPGFLESARIASEMTLEEIQERAEREGYETDELESEDIFRDICVLAQEEEAKEVPFPEDDLEQWLMDLWFKYSDDVEIHGTRSVIYH